MEIWYPAVMIGVITAGLSLVGILLGKRIGDRFRKWIDSLFYRHPDCCGTYVFLILFLSNLGRSTFINAVTFYGIVDKIDIELNAGIRKMYNASGEKLYEK